jgi:hypothetical protein
VRPEDLPPKPDPLAEATSRRDEALARVEGGVSEEWKAQALDAVRRLCSTRPSFTADDVWEQGLVKPREARALGPVLRRAQALDVCEPTDEFVLSRQPQCHAMPRRVWRSLLFTTERSHGSDPRAD